jgi:OOP family OmpA-OmpF porin
MKLRSMLAVATCLVAPVIAHAQPVTGPYVNLGGGVNILYPVNASFANGRLTSKLLFRPSYSVLGGVGFGFGDGFRVEFDGSYLRDTAHKIDGTGAAAGADDRVTGAENNYGGFANVFYDIPVGLPVFPFVGAGAGYQFVSYDPQITDGDPATHQNFRIYHDEGSFAYDVLAGLSYPIPMVPGLSLTATYRFMQLTESRKYAVLASTGAHGVVKIGQESSHSFLVGVRYQIFNPPPPAPAPTPVVAPPAAPAPSPAKTYLVFFDWDKYNLTPRALDIISQAAADSKTTQTTTIDVSGYTDTSGTPVYNQGLSERRAKAVAAQLVADGVAASEIETHAFGETHLLVPTGPGVREPQNRRVEIVLQ